MLQYMGKYPANGVDAVVSTAWTTILELPQQFLLAEETFGVWDIEIQNNGSRDVTGIRFRHAMDHINYGSFMDIPDAYAVSIVPLLTAGQKVRIRLFIPVGTLKIEAKTTSADGAMQTWFERSEINFEEVLVDGISLATLVASATANTSVIGEKTAAMRGIFGASHEKDIEPLYFHDNVANNGVVSHDDDLSAVDLEVTVTDTDAAHMQSKRRFKMRHGTEMEYRFDFLMGAAVANVYKKIGCFDNYDGFYLHQDESGELSFVMRSFATGAAVSTAAFQDSWNIDKLDGSGPSLKTLDIEDMQQMFIHTGDMAGYVEFGFIIDGEVIVAHRVNVGNNNAIPTASWLTLPLAAVIVNNGGSATGAHLYMFSWYVGTHGDVFEKSLRIAVDTTDTPEPLLAAGSFVLGVRPKVGTNYELGGVVPRGGMIMAEPVARYSWRVVVGGAPVGAIAYGDTSTTRTEYGVDNAGAVVGGITVANGYGMGVVTLPEFNLDEMLEAWVGLLPGVDLPDNIFLEITAIDDLNAFLALDFLELM